MQNFTFSSSLFRYVTLVSYCKYDSANVYDLYVSWPTNCFFSLYTEESMIPPSKFRCFSPSLRQQQAPQALQPPQRSRPSTGSVRLQRSASAAAAASKKAAVFRNQPQPQQSQQPSLACAQCSNRPLSQQFSPTPLPRSAASSAAAASAAAVGLMSTAPATPTGCRSPTKEQSLARGLMLASFCRLGVVVFLGVFEM